MRCTGRGLETEALIRKILFSGNGSPRPLNNAVAIRVPSDCSPFRPKSALP
jgi:hypothetical protein